MLFFALQGLFLPSLILYFLIIWGFTGYAYRVNGKLPDDLKKKDFRPAAIFLAPITLPFLFLGIISLLILKAFLYGVFLVLLTLALVVFRKPFIFVWLHKIATKVGNFLLEANTQLIKMFLSPWSSNPQQT